MFQDVASIEVQKNKSNNKVQVQVVGDVYMYGTNYIYEPVYVHLPIIYTTFWATNYRPYCSVWNWNYYPSYYYTPMVTPMMMGVPMYGATAPSTNQNTVNNYYYNNSGQNGQTDSESGSYESALNSYMH